MSTLQRLIDAICSMDIGEQCHVLYAKTGLNLPVNIEIAAREELAAKDAELSFYRAVFPNAARNWNRLQKKAPANKD